MQDVQHINRTGGVVAGALPLLYGMAERIVTSVTPREPAPAVRPPARPRPAPGGPGSPRASATTPTRSPRGSEPTG